MFCGSEGRMSEEHVFGKWLLDFEIETHRVPHVGGGINTLGRTQERSNRESRHSTDIRARRSFGPM